MYDFNSLKSVIDRGDVSCSEWLMVPATPRTAPRGAVMSHGAHITTCRWRRPFPAIPHHKCHEPVLFGQMQLLTVMSTVHSGSLQAGKSSAACFENVITEELFSLVACCWAGLGLFYMRALAKANKKGKKGPLRGPVPKENSLGSSRLEDKC
ncbi:hypothetical protein E2C01_035301 [Portunus trituberculatus]|uniref:Uncharacterized protein n=1 Tax=Portunus trituberculatus TaxID=210409 RepID=A0A5B7F3V4_PORTR|nr:hypothetical protein [Portunus trituberculatus]